MAKGPIKAYSHSHIIMQIIKTILSWYWCKLFVLNSNFENIFISFHKPNFCCILQSTKNKNIFQTRAFTFSILLQFAITLHSTSCFKCELRSRAWWSKVTWSLLRSMHEAIAITMKEPTEDWHSFLSSNAILKMWYNIFIISLQMHNT